MLIGMGLLLGFLIGGTAESILKALILLALMVLFLFYIHLWIVQFGFLVDALKNKEIVYFFSVLILGVFVWRVYTRECIKPRLARMTGTTSSGEGLH